MNKIPVRMKLFGNAEGFRLCRFKIHSDKSVLIEEEKLKVLEAKFEKINAMIDAAMSTGLEMRRKMIEEQMKLWKEATGEDYW